RRHTRFSRDWSSDVCSSDLNLLAVWLFLLPVWGVAAEHPDSLFSKGNRLYAAGDYQGAAAVYETLVNEGYVEVAVFYNLGNAHRSEERRGGKGRRCWGRARA